jgi:hypothetical protein
MTSSGILHAYLSLFGLHLIVDLALSMLNLRHVKKCRDALPEIFRGWLDLPTYQTAASYTLAKGRFAVCSRLYGAVVLLVFVLSGWFGALEGIIASWHFGAYTQGVLYVLCNRRRVRLQ